MLEKAMGELLSKKSRYHGIEAKVTEKPKYKVGRPKDGVREIDRILYEVQGEVVEQNGKVKKFKKEAGCIVLLSNVPKKGEMGHSSVEVLEACKDQYGIEQNFGFLKDPVIVNSIFLKKAERIEVLGLIFLISLLIWRLIERTMRNFIKQTKNDLPGWKNRRTARPTSFMLTTKFMGIIVLKVGGARTLNKPLTNQQIEYLHALGVRLDSFINPKLE